jgi:putative hydrolase of the HAD superfamily
MTTIRAVLCDLDGVIRDWSGQDDAGIERRFGLPPGAIKGVAFAPELLLPAITGGMTDEAWRASVVDRLRERHPDVDAAGAVAAWSEPAGEIDRQALALIQAARERVPVALVTNASSRLDADLARLGMQDAFDHIVNSSAVGSAKPDRAIYEHALALVGAKPAEALYIDDTDRYLGPAGALGLRCHHYRGIDGLRDALATHGLITRSRFPHR